MNNLLENWHQGQELFKHYHQDQDGSCFFRKTLDIGLDPNDLKATVELS